MTDFLYVENKIIARNSIRNDARSVKKKMFFIFLNWHKRWSRTMIVGIILVKLRTSPNINWLEELKKNLEF